jgi:phosphotransferase system enzyme I (PtsI)
MPRPTQTGTAEVEMRGIGVSPGVVSGTAVLLSDAPVATVARKIARREVDAEIAKFENALIETRRQILEIQRDLEDQTGTGDASILDAHLMVLDDRTFLEQVVEDIRNKRKNAEHVVKTCADRYAEVLSALGDEYLRERVADVRDVSRRIIANMSRRGGARRENVFENRVIVARDLAPSETATLRKQRVLGFATDLGSPTSHTAVVARALEIPAVVGLMDVTAKVATGDEVLIDGNKGVLVVNPSHGQLAKYGRVAKARRAIEDGLANLRHEPAQTVDGHKVTLAANIEGPEEVDAVLDHGAEGVGLFRSEYLYLWKGGAITEDEQAAVYDLVASRLAPAPVVIRTLDIGGDKFVGGVGYPGEANPFLGCRSIRLSLREPEGFKAQLRAILRASRHGNVKIMYPMVSSAGEVVRANELLEEAKADLTKTGIPFRKDIEVGAMIEIPSAALTADVIAEHVRFFSLGTNDLIQYTIAVDRGNERVAYLYQPTHPAIVRLIRQTVDAARRRDIWVGVCGEMAADPVIALLLLGLGVNEMSMSPSAVPLVKDAIRSVAQAQTVELAETALSCKSAEEVLSHCRRLMQEVAPEILQLF